jgi:hypothetical protein
LPAFGSRAAATCLVETAEPVLSGTAMTAASVTAIRLPLPALLLAAEAEEHGYHGLAEAFRSRRSGNRPARPADGRQRRGGEVLLLARM